MRKFLKQTVHFCAAAGLMAGMFLAQAPRVSAAEVTPGGTPETRRERQSSRRSFISGGFGWRYSVNRGAFN